MSRRNLRSQSGAFSPTSYTENNNSLLAGANTTKYLGEIKESQNDEPSINSN